MYQRKVVKGESKSWWRAGAGTSQGGALWRPLWRAGPWAVWLQELQGQANCSPPSQAPTPPGDNRHRGGPGKPLKTLQKGGDFTPSDPTHSRFAHNHTKNSVRLSAKSGRSSSPEQHQVLPTSQETKPGGKDGLRGDRSRTGPRSCRPQSWRPPSLTP